MSIRVICPNGHILNVKDHLAGKVGLCPMCKARVQVPRPQRESVSEDAIMGILGSQPDAVGQFSDAVAVDSAKPPPTAASDKNSPPKKSCHKCNQEIETGIHICPHCHTYIAELTDF